MSLTISNTTHLDLVAKYVILADEVIEILHGLRNGTIKSTSVEKRIVKSLWKSGITYEKETKAPKLPNPQDTDPYRSGRNPGN